VSGERSIPHRAASGPAWLKQQPVSSMLHVKSARPLRYAFKPHCPAASPQTSLVLTLTGQRVQEACVTPFSRELKVPAGHLTGLTVLVLGQYEPAGQGCKLEGGPEALAVQYQCRYCSIPG